MKYECPCLSTTNCGDTNELRASSGREKIDETPFAKHSTLCTTPKFDNCPTYLNLHNRIQRGAHACQQ
jgi:hypothetical protein